MTDRRGDWSFPTAVRFGAGRLAELAEAARAAGLARPLLVSDRGLAGSEIVARARGILSDAGLGDAVFAEVGQNPDETDLAAGLAAFREGGHDGVVAIGGGSALDLGKLVALMAGQTRPVWDFEDVGDRWTRADAAAIRPIVAVPTTAGTGSEVGRAGVLTDAAKGRKVIVFHPRMLPAQVICDPELTLGLPRGLTVGTGFDALAHNLEAWLSPHWQPLCAGIALEGLRLALAALPRVAARPDDLGARADMMAAAAMGAIAFQKGLGAIHALSHPIGARFGTHHGTTNAVVAPAVLDWLLPTQRRKLDEAAAHAGVAGGAEGLLARIGALRAELGVPDTLGDLGVPREAIPALIPGVLADPSCGGSPVALDAAAAAALLEAAFRPTR